MSPAAAAEGLLLIGHGTRNDEGTAEFLELAKMVRARSSGPVEAAFLELRQPTIADGWQRLISAGVQSIRAVPVLLWAAGHALRDIPEQLRMLAEQTPGVRVTQAAVLGEHAALLARAEMIVHDLLNAGSVPQQRTALIVAGRGSTSDAATQRMIAWTELRARRLPELMQVEVGFVAMARPSLGSVLDQIGSEATVGQVLVQPHLLFTGELRCTVCRMTAAAAERFPRITWRVAPPLGAHPLVAEAVGERASAAEFSGPSA